MKNLIRNARLEKGWKLKDLAQSMGVDQALISKYESGNRIPSKDQVRKLANLLELDLEELMIQWLSEKIIYDIGDDELALKAMMVAEERLRYKINPKNIVIHKGVKTLLDEIDRYKKKLMTLRKNDSFRIAQALELEYTFESNRIEGNTLTLKETDLVINEGITISGKSVREHLEAINHQEALLYLKELVQRKRDLRESDVLSLHQLILRSIDTLNAGAYRKVQVMISGSSHIPPQPYLVAKQMEDTFHWYDLNKAKLHPVLLAAEMSERIVTIHPFIDGNGRTSRLIMNLILLRHGYVIANIKGDRKNRMAYYDALEQVQVNDDKIPFYLFVAENELSALKRYIEILSK